MLKKNTILIGDSITDCLMANTKNILKIGFLKAENKIFLKNYLNNFDLVILGEGDFLLLDFLFKYIISTKIDNKVLESSLNYNIYKKNFNELF